ncbi:very-long-chain (3R)-3-hydroxyacyl-CoA dehydratase PASTICCINO 2A-like [Solanum verrucosum]|uniref:very-long-chain (3R)-3-hydroxyacyl-CoA dehydratase PASTICCINO 2A-like n=1 Tax=Solanum verrucosum TaxID=315347 RepID=UPI0020D1A90F|nr:very-long-chain (3R)-3-hydroxyacyl-CoA dehydratase PASTICCINO 2A-like [Solanum verrucosum]
MAVFLSGLRHLYLIFYNWIVFFGWFQVFYFGVKTLKESGYEYVYDAVEKPLLFAQTAAFFEILHSLAGLVRSPISSTLPQISSRLYVTWGILWSFPEVSIFLADHIILVSSLVISWSITEIIRYSFFGTREAFGSAPSWLLWLRYSTFLLLYPIGITSEVGLIYNALPYMKEYGKYSIRMPNKWNFSFDYYYAAFVCLAIYLPGKNHNIILLLKIIIRIAGAMIDEDDVCENAGFSHLYSYMLGQRKKALSEPKKHRTQAD